MTCFGTWLYYNCVGIWDGSICVPCEDLDHTTQHVPLIEGSKRRLVVPASLDPLSLEGITPLPSYVLPSFQPCSFAIGLPVYQAQ